MNRSLIKLCFLFVFGLSFAALADTDRPGASLDATFDIKSVETRNLELSDEKWFMEDFVRSYLAVYQDKTFFISTANGPRLLGAKDIETKQTWLLETARDEFANYVTKPLKGYKAIVVTYKKAPAGALMYRLLDDQRTIYLAQFFISPDFQNKGIGPRVLNDIMPSLHPNHFRHELVVRHQNDAALLLYSESGFLVGDVAMVQKYDYDPLRYISFYKDVKKLSE